MTGFKVLLVEDDNNLREAIAETLAMAQIDFIAVKNGKEALLTLQSEHVGLVLSDIQMPELDGITLLRSIKQKLSGLPVVLMTAYGDIQNAVEAMRLGAIDYLVKPFETKALLDIIDQFTSKAATHTPVVASTNSIALLNSAKHVAMNDATVLITGESGTGKEVLARYIHQNSLRKEKPFIAINCAAIPENMLEAVLFGHEKGSFTGAYQTAQGKFELADGGTILLDEISEMNLGLQAKLLRVLQEREIDRLGSRKSISIDVRVIATSNRNLIDEVRNNKFREDLYYRLNVIPLHWPSLRDRKEDIVPMAEFFLKKHSEKMKMRTPSIDDAAKNKLAQYSWPGNVRELENFMQRALIFSTGEKIEESDIVFPEKIIREDSIELISEDESLSTDVKKHEYKVIAQALKEHNGNRKIIAEKLGISPRTLRYKLARMREEGLDTVF